MSSRRKIIQNLLIVITLCLLTLSSSIAEAKLQILTTTTNLAWLAKEIAGDKAEVNSFLTGGEDVHYISAKPSFIHKASNADILCSVGLGLELGWLPKVLEKSANARIQPGGKGHCVLSEGIPVLEKIEKNVNRAMGDVHPEGNPHFSLSPEHLIQAATNFLGIISAVDPANSDYYIARYETTKNNLQALHESLRKEIGAKISGNAKILEYHKEFTYFLHAYGLQSAGAMEELPGVPPSAGRIAKVALQAKSSGVILAIATPYNPQKVVQRVSTIAQIPSVVLPVHLQEGTEYDSYPKLQKYLATKILETLKQ